MRTYAIIAAENGGTQGGADGEPEQSNPYGMFIIMGLIFVVFYFLLIRPQRKKEKDRQKQRQEMLGNLRKNDHILTIGGIHGVVGSVTEDEVVIKVDEKGDVRLRMSRDAISKIVGLDDAEGGEKRLGDDENK